MSAAISVIRNSIHISEIQHEIRGKKNNKPNKGKVHHMKYLEGSAAVEQRLGWQNLLDFRMLISYLNSSHVGSSFKPL